MAALSMGKTRYPRKYNKLRRLPFHMRAAAKARIDAGEGMYGSAFLAVYAKPVEPSTESPKNAKGEWKEIVVPEPVRKLQAAFKTLNLPEDGATLKSAKKAYYEAAFKTHPDHGGSDEDFKTVKAAYDQIVKYLS